MGNRQLALTMPGAQSGTCSIKIEEQGSGSGLVRFVPRKVPAA